MTAASPLQNPARTVVRVRYLSKALATARFFPGTGGTFIRGLKSFGPFKAARRFLGSLRQFLQEPRSILAVSTCPGLSCLVFHAVNKAWSWTHEVQRNSAVGAQSYE